MESLPLHSVVDSLALSHAVCGQTAEKPPYRTGSERRSIVSDRGLSRENQMVADLIEVMQPSADIKQYRGRLYLDGEPLRR